MKSILSSLLLIVGSLSPLSTFAQKGKSDPVEVFDRFWQTMDRHYAFFELKQIDWEAVRQTYRPKIDARTTDEELFELLSEILAPFRDAHLKLKAPAPLQRTFSGGQPSLFESEFSTDSLKRVYFELVENSLATLGFDSLRQAGPILSARNAIYDHAPFEYSRSERVGYVKVSWFFYDFQNLGLFSRGRDRRNFLAAFGAILDELSTVDALIIDLRNNIGGVSGYPERLAANFSDRKQIGEYTCRRKKGGHEAFTRRKPTWMQPRRKEAFLRPVILLVNDQTVSACEEFVMMMRGLPQVTILGTPTQGALSDIYEKELPNGWTLGLSNMRFYSRDLICYENVGIPVDLRVENRLLDLETGVDPVLSAAMKAIAEQ